MKSAVSCARPAGWALISALALGMASPALGSETLSYTYDTLGRLVKVARTGTANNGATECFAYDPASNRSNVTVNTASNCSSGGGATLSVANASATEGSNLGFVVSLSGTISGNVTVNYATANGTATSGSDYTTKSGTLTFVASPGSQTVNVVTIDDTTIESSETVLFNLSGASGATIITAQGTGTITDNDGAGTCSGVSFSISSNGAVTEGTNSVFTVTKTGTATGSCTVNYATANGTAVAPGDYTTKTGTLTFTSAQTSQTVGVTTIDDVTVESAETFTTTLSAPSGGATIGTGTATGNINDNDSSGACSGVSFSVSDAPDAIEAASLTFTVTKTGTTTSSCSVNFASANGTAAEPLDYTAVSGTLTFTSAQTSKTVSVVTNSNGLNAEPDESVFLNLSSPTLGSTISDTQGVGWIVDDGLGGGGGGCPPNCDSPIQAPETGSDEPAPIEEAPVDPADPPPDATEPPPPGGAS